MLYYKQDVLSHLKEKGYNTNVILKNNLIGQSSMTKIRNGEVVGIKTIERLCQLLDCQPADLIGYKPDDKKETPL